LPLRLDTSALSLGMLAFSFEKLVLCPSPHRIAVVGRFRDVNGFIYYLKWTIW